jgi:YgiT-type zinc finger domain-containing protein
VRCAVCRHDMVRKEGEIDLRIEGTLYLARNVSYEECSFCGEKILTPYASKILYEKVRKKEFVEQTIRVAVLDGTYS